MAASHFSKNVLETQNYVKVSGMDFEQFLDKQAGNINERLREILLENVEKFGEYETSLGKLFSAFSESTAKGKRIRGALVLLGYKVAGGKDLKAIIDAALALEIFQTSILAQDDIIDKSDMRRGEPALHKKLGGDHKAVSQTICLSDLGIFLSFRLLSSLKVQDSLKIRAINFFSQALMQTVAGELLDIEVSDKKRFIEEEVLKIGLLKTARYTISGPLVLGAILNGADIKLIKLLQNFGDNLGIGFQIQDDILGVYASEEIIGKSAVSDIKEGKATLLSVYGFNNAKDSDLKFLQDNYGDTDISEKDAQRIRDIFKEIGALKYAEVKAEKYFEEAARALKEGEEGLLYSLVEYIKGRQK